jgi:hypothetical protein
VKWLSPPAERKYATCHWIKGVNQHDVLVALEAHVLKSVVKKKNVRTKLGFQALSNAKPVHADSNVCAAGSNEGLRFVPRQFDGSIFTLADYDHGFRRASAISAGQNRDVPAGFAKSPRKMGDQ